MLTYKGKEVTVTLRSPKRKTCNIVDANGNVYRGVPESELKKKQPKPVEPPKETEEK